MISKKKKKQSVISHFPLRFTEEFGNLRERLTSFAHKEKDSINKTILKAIEKYIK